jgi:4-hydroxybenzoate polyprenyltransferase
LIGFTLAVFSGQSSFSWEKLILVILCMVLARSAAMAYNRYADRHYDAKNPRTMQREIPAGTVSPAAALAFTIFCSVSFVVTTWFINSLCFALSPVALLVILGYSYTKRFTPLCHLVLGLGLGLAPVGAYVAVTADFNVVPVLFGAVVFFWVSGFDVIYALQDDDFDRSERLYSLPVYLGRKKALLLSRLFHTLVAALVISIYFIGSFGWLYVAGALVFISLLIFQHRLVREDDLSRVNLAFATSNGIASVAFAMFVCSDIFVNGQL